MRNIFIFFFHLENISEDQPEANHESITLVKEFFELSQAEESFLERKASIRRSLRLKKECHGSQTLIEPTDDFLIETYSTDDIASEMEASKVFEDEDIRQLETHLNRSIGRIINKISKIKRSSNKKRTTMSVNL